MLSGAYKAFKYRKYATCYPGAFAYRFNRRFDLADLVVRLIIDVACTMPAPERVISMLSFVSNQVNLRFN